MFHAAKIRISEQNTKLIWVFSNGSIFSLSEKIVQNFDLAKEMRIYFHFWAWESWLNRTKNQIYYSIFLSLHYSRPLSLQRHTPYLQVGEGTLNLRCSLFSPIILLPPTQGDKRGDLSDLTFGLLLRTSAIQASLMALGLSSVGRFLPDRALPLLSLRASALFFLVCFAEKSLKFYKIFIYIC